MDIRRPAVIRLLAKGRRLGAIDWTHDSCLSKSSPPDGATMAAVGIPVSSRPRRITADAADSSASRARTVIMGSHIAVNRDHVAWPERCLWRSRDSFAAADRDAHGADDATRDVLGFVARRSPAAAVLGSQGRTTPRSRPPAARLLGRSPRACPRLSLSPRSLTDVERLARAPVRTRAVPRITGGTSS